MENSDRARSFLEITTSFLIGAAILLAPVALDATHKRYEAAVFPIIRDAVEGVRPVSLLLLLLFGAVMGAVFRRPAIVLAVAAVAIFPLWSIADLAMGGKSHNLLPLEWIFYAGYAVITLAGIAAGRSMRRLATKR